MNDKVYSGILIAVTLLGVVSVIALLAITSELYDNVSIISYIANGR